MPQRRAAIKDLRKNRKRKLHNLTIKTDLRKTIKKFLVLIKDKNLNESKETLKLLYKKLDKASKKNIIHRNTASRRKSRFQRLLNSVNA